MSHGKQFTLYSFKSAPNGWKDVFVLEALGLSYETVYLDFTKGEHKAPEHTKYNPNGRIPTLIDHKNNDFVIWESIAIMIYLVDKYDINHKISAVNEDEKYEQFQWLLFQASGQGSDFAQSWWFQRAHPEKIQSAIDRYNNEIRRIFGVLDGVLAQRDYLVGNEATIADLSFIPWNTMGISLLEPGFDFEKEYPAVAKWHNNLLTLDAVKKTLQIKASVNASVE